MASNAIGVGFIGASWMARVHAHALHTINHVAPLARRIRLVAIAGRRPEQAERAARELGFDRSAPNWEAVVGDPQVTVVANLAPDVLHAPVSIAALRRGKPVLCEKPLARDPAEALAMVAAAEAAGVPSACGFNYRFVPAIRLAREIVAAGRLGRLRHFRAVYLQDWAASPLVARTWRFERRSTGSGAVGDHSHIIDLLRYLAGEPVSATGELGHFIRQRPDPFGSGELLPVEVEDAYAAALRLDNGALATLEASRVATGRKGRQVIELNGSDGSLWWDMEDLNRLHVFFTTEEATGLGGFRDVLVTQPDHPFMQHWWAPGHVLGWEHTFVHQWRAFLEAVLAGQPLAADQASFVDGYRAVQISAAILTAAAEGRRVALMDEQGEWSVR
jgi:predicted dehydrogenase